MNEKIENKIRALTKVAHRESKKTKTHYTQEFVSDGTTRPYAVIDGYEIGTVEGGNYHSIKHEDNFYKPTLLAKFAKFRLGRYIKNNNEIIYSDYDEIKKITSDLFTESYFDLFNTIDKFKNTSEQQNEFMYDFDYNKLNDYDFLKFYFSSSSNYLKVKMVESLNSREFSSISDIVSISNIF